VHLLTPIAAVPLSSGSLVGRQAPCLKPTFFFIEPESCVTPCLYCHRRCFAVFFARILFYSLVCSPFFPYDCSAFETTPWLRSLAFSCYLPLCLCCLTLSPAITLSPSFLQSVRSLSISLFPVDSHWIVNILCCDRSFGNGPFSLLWIWSSMSSWRRHELLGGSGQCCFGLHYVSLFPAFPTWNGFP